MDEWPNNILSLRFFLFAKSVSANPGVPIEVLERPKRDLFLGEAASLQARLLSVRQTDRYLPPLFLPAEEAPLAHKC